MEGFDGCDVLSGTAPIQSMQQSTPSWLLGHFWQGTFLVRLAVLKQPFLCSNSLYAVIDKLDTCLAWLFGLDECKYQWALDRHNQMQLEVGLEQVFDQLFDTVFTAR